MELFMGEKCSDKFWPRIRLPRNSRDLLHAANLRHGTDGFASPPKEGVMRIFSPLKIRRLRPGLNPRTWVPKASMLPLDHRSRYFYYILIKYFCIYIYTHSFIGLCRSSCSNSNAFEFCSRSLEYISRPYHRLWLSTKFF